MGIEPRLSIHLPPTAMNPSSRAKLLRRRFSAVGGTLAVAGQSVVEPVGLFRATNSASQPTVRKTRASAYRPNPKAWKSSVYGVAVHLHEPDNRTKWIRVPDPVTKPVPKPKRRRKGASALTKIAEQVGKKLPVVSGWDWHARH